MFIACKPADHTEKTIWIESTEIVAIQELQLSSQQVGSRIFLTSGLEIDTEEEAANLIKDIFEAANTRVKEIKRLQDETRT